MHLPEALSILAAYRPEFAEEVRKVALMRATDQALARHFGIPLATLDEWLASVPEFARAARYGGNLADADIVDRFHRIAMGRVHKVVKKPAGARKEVLTDVRHRPPSRSARSFWLANRLAGAWCRRSEVDAEPRRGIPRGSTGAELSRVIAACVAAREDVSGE